MKSLILAVFVFCTLRTLAVPPPEAEVAEPFGIALYSEKNVTPKVKELAQKVAKAFGMPEPQQMNRNPTCCVWLEVTNWTPGPGKPGYVIIHQGGGTVITASTEFESATAVDRFIAVAKDKGGRKVVPTGLMTNYDIVK